MTIFNLNGKDSGVWFDLEDGGRVQVRTMDAETLRAIRTETVKRKIEYKRVEGKAERFTVEDTDDEEQSALFWDHVIMAWEKFFDGHEQPIPCTRENKILLLARSQRFAKFLGECLEKLNADELATAEADKENL